MGMLDRKYRDGVRSYILSMGPEEKKRFQYQLYSQIAVHRRALRDMKEELAEEVAALAFLQAEMFVLPFKRRAEDRVSVAQDDAGKEMQAERPDNIQRKQA